MMDRREALLLVDRLKRRTRDPDVLTLCEYVHGTDVHGTVQGFRRPDVPWTQPAVMPPPPARCARHVGRQRRRGKKDGAMGAETDADVRVAWSAARQPCPGVAPEGYCVRAGRGTGHGRPILWQLRNSGGAQASPVLPRCPSTQTSWSGMQSSPPPIQVIMTVPAVG
jgi:hypothetical protein